MLVQSELVCQRVSGCNKRMRRSEREFAGHHPHLHASLPWHKDLELEAAGELANVPLKGSRAKQGDGEYCQNCQVGSLFLHLSSRVRLVTASLTVRTKEEVWEACCWRRQRPTVRSTKASLVS